MFYYKRNDNGNNIFKLIFMGFKYLTEVKRKILKYIFTITYIFLIFRLNSQNCI